MKERRKKERSAPDGQKNKALPGGRAGRVLWGAAFVMGLFIFLTFFSYLIRQCFFPEGRSAVVIASAVSVCALLPLLVYRPLGARKPRVALVLLSLYCLFALFFCVTFAIHLGQTCLFPEPDSDETLLSADAVLIVFGSKVNGTQPARPLACRLDRAIGLLEAHPGLLCVVTGGQGPDEQIPEGVAMYNYLTDHGIDGERILIESEARDTKQNIELTKKLLDDRGLSERQVACVSTGFHLPRIRLLMQRAGYEDVLCFSAPSPTAGSLIFSLIREYCSRAKLILGI